MKHLQAYGYQLLLFLLLPLMCLVVACGGPQNVHGNQAVNAVEEGTFVARALLTLQQQREYDKLFLESQRQKHKGNYDACRELLAASLRVNPNASEALYELGRLETAFPMKTDSATVVAGDEMLLRAHQLEPSNPYIGRALAQRWIRLGKYARAAKLYEELVRQHPRSEDLGVLLGIYESLPDFPAALNTIERYESLEGVDENTVLERFKILLKMGRTTEAYGAVEQLCAEHPDELRYRVLLGDLYMQNGNAEKALEIYDDVRASDPDNPLVRLAMLQYYIEQGDTVSFDSAMKSAMLDPKVENSHKVSLLRGYANALLQGKTAISAEKMLGYYRLALSIPQETSELGELCLAFISAAKLPSDSTYFATEAILRDQPDHMEARLQLLYTLITQNRADELEKVCREGYEHYPEKMLFYYYRAMALLQEQRDEEAFEVLLAGTAKAAPPDSCEGNDADLLTEMYQFLGDLYQTREMPAKSFDAYEHSLEYDPDNIVTLNNYAYFLALKGTDLDKAAEMSKRAVDAEPKNGTYIDTYAWVLYCKRQYTQARIYIEQVFMLMTDEERQSPSSATLYDHAGDIYAKCGNRQKAVEHWKQALTLTQDAEVAKKIKAKLKK